MPEHDDRPTPAQGDEHAGADAIPDVLRTPHDRAAHMLMTGHSRAETAAELERDGLSGVQARHVTDEVFSGLERQIASERPTSGSLPRALVGGAAAALAGGIGWGLLTWKSGWEIGIAAWGIGWLAAYCVVAATGGRRGRPLQVIALVAAVAGIALGKYLTVYFVSHEADPELSVLDPRLVEYCIANLDRLFGIFDLVFLGLAMITAWGMLAPTHASAVRRLRPEQQSPPSSPR